MTMTKNEFKKLVKMQAFRKMESNDRRRRLDGRTELNAFNMVEDLLPEVIRYDVTANGNIKADYIAKNLSKYKNLHIFTNNTIGITEYDNNPYRIILILKASYLGALKVKTSDIYGKRLTLTEVMKLVEDGKAKQYSKLTEALGL